MEALGLPMLKDWMGVRKVFRRAPTQGQAIAELEPRSKAAEETEHYRAAKVKVAA